jgi:hypothetical protein
LLQTNTKTIIYPIKIKHIAYIFILLKCHDQNWERTVRLISSEAGNLTNSISCRHAIHYITSERTTCHSNRKTLTGYRSMPSWIAFSYMPTTPVKGNMPLQQKNTT